MENIIEEIKKIRKSKKISQSEIGNYLSISQGTYRDIESGKIRLSLDNYLLICKYLKIDPTKLINDNSKKKIELTDKEAEILKHILKQL